MSTSVTRQIVSGLRLTAAGFLCFGLLFVLLDGELRINECFHSGDCSTYGLLGYVELLVVAILLWVTVRVWSRWAAAVAFVGAIKGTFGLVAGVGLVPPFRPFRGFSPPRPWHTFSSQEYYQSGLCLDRP